MRDLPGRGVQYFSWYLHEIKESDRNEEQSWQKNKQTSFCEEMKSREER